MSNEKENTTILVSASDYRDLLSLVVNTKRVTKIVLEDVISCKRSDEIIAALGECFSLLQNLYEMLVAPLEDEESYQRLVLELKKQKDSKSKSKDPETAIGIDQEHLFLIKSMIATVTLLREKIRDDFGINMHLH